MKLSTTLNIYSVRRDGNDPELALRGIKVLKEAGYDAIDFFFRDLQEKDEGYQDEWVERALGAMGDNGIKATQAHSYLVKTRYLDQDEIASYEKRIRRSIELSSRLGALNLVIHPLCFFGPDGNTKSFEESLEINRAFYSSLADDLDKKGVRCAIENLPHTEYESAEALLALYEKIGMPSLFGFCWDTGHANLCPSVKEDQAGEIGKLGKKLIATHIQDNHGAKDEHILPMMGDINWLPIVRALKESGYEGDFTYESAQPLKYLPTDDILRKQMIDYSVQLGRYLLELR